MTLPPFHLLGGVEATLVASHSRGPSRLRVHYPGAGVRIPTKAAPQTFAQRGVQALPRPVDVPSSEPVVDGLITNDKFCFTRRSRLKLRPKRRGYPPPKDVRRGGIDETELDRSTHDGRPRRRHPSLGSGLPAPPPMGGLEGNPEGGGD